MRERLLTRLFVRRFLDNDLISPDADRHETLAVLCAIFASTSLFVTVVIAMKYQLAPFTSPGRTAVLVLDDRFLYIAGSMIVMALVAVAAWDALPLDARDASILGPLPIPRGAIIRAKLAAIAIVAGGCVVVLNVVPSVLRPWMMPARLPLGGVDGLVLMAMHALVTVAAGAFGFFAVLALRELLHLVLGTAWFMRISLVLQASLVVVLATLLLMLPGTHAGVARSWLAPGARVAASAVPPLWYVGLHETLAGDVIDGLPRAPDPGRAEQEATALYRSRRPAFEGLARLALMGLAVVGGVAVSAYAWNSRRKNPLTPPAPRSPFPRAEKGRGGRVEALIAPARPRSGRADGLMASARLRSWLVRRWVAPGGEARAGFYFALQVLSRSVPHRLVLATSVAVGLAAAAVWMGGFEVRRIRDTGSIPVAVLAAQTVLVTALLVGFRHAVRVPAELRANWIFHLAWSRDERPYLAGVKRAALIAVVAPALLVLSAWHALVLGPRLALAHLAFGVLTALIVLEGLCLGVRKLPFVSSYLPTSILRSAAPLYVTAAFLATYVLAWVERLALHGIRRTLVFLALAAGVWTLVRTIDRRQRRTRLPIELDEPPPEATQRLGLSG